MLRLNRWKMSPNQHGICVLKTLEIRSQCQSASGCCHIAVINCTLLQAVGSLAAYAAYAQDARELSGQLQMLQELEKSEIIHFCVVPGLSPMRRLEDPNKGAHSVDPTCHV